VRRRWLGQQLLIVSGERILVFGPRDYADRDFVWTTLSAIHAESPIACVVHGDATGVDGHARDWAIFHGIEHDPYPADWERIDGPNVRIGVGRNKKPYNILAGFNRNGEMLRLGCPTRAASFPDPTKWKGTPGTNDMMSKVRSAVRMGASIDPVETYHHPKGFMFKERKR